MKLLQNIFSGAILLSSVLVSPATFAEVININTANAEEIASGMQGVGNNKAKAIVEYRRSHGNFKSLQDIENVDGIGEKTVEKNKDNIIL